MSESAKWEKSVEERVQVRRELIMRMFRLGAVKCEPIALKTGELTPIYFNLRLLISDPQLLNDVSLEMIRTIEDFAKECGEPTPKLLCGVPYAALPIASCVSLNTKIPMIMCRKERKDYGTKQLIEGKFAPGDECLIVEDVIAFGTSLGEISEVIRCEGLVAKKGIVLVDRDQDAVSNLKENYSLNVKSVFTLEDILKVLVEAKEISLQTADDMRAFVRRNCYKRTNKDNLMAEPTAVKMGVHKQSLKFQNCLRQSHDEGIFSLKLTDQLVDNLSKIKLPEKVGVLVLNPEMLFTQIGKPESKLIKILKSANRPLIIDYKAFLEPCEQLCSKLSPLMTFLCAEIKSPVAVTVSGFGICEFLEEFRQLADNCCAKSKWMETCSVVLMIDSTTMPSYVNMESYRVDCKSACERFQDLISAVVTTKPFSGTIRDLSGDMIPYFIPKDTAAVFNRDPTLIKARFGNNVLIEIEEEEFTKLL